MTSTNCEKASSNIPSSMADLQPNQFTTPEIRSASDHKAVVVGLYGIPGSGKTFLLNQLKQELGQMHFAFYEGSEMIATVVPRELLRRDQEKMVQTRGNVRILSIFTTSLCLAENEAKNLRLCSPPLHHQPLCRYYYSG